jgi:EpsI family protein
LSLVLVGHYSEMQNYLIVEDHSLFGWVVFVVFMTPLLYVHRVLPLSSTGSAPPTAPAGSVPAGPAGPRRAAVYFACIALALGVFLNYRIDGGSPVSDVVLAAPGIPGWSGKADWLDARRPEFVGATAEFARWYEDGTARVGAYVAHYARQEQGHEVVFSQHRPQGQGAVVSRQRITLQVTAGSPLTFDQLEIADFGAKRRLVWVGLRVAGQVASGETAAKVLQIAGALRGRRDAQALVLTTECDDDCNHAAATLSRYAAAAAERLYVATERSAQRGLSEQVL